MSHFQWQIKGPIKGLFNATSSHDSRWLSLSFVLVWPVCICLLKNSCLIASSEMRSSRALPSALVVSIMRSAHHTSCGCLDKGTGTFPQDSYCYRIIHSHSSKGDSLFQKSAKPFTAVGLCWQGEIHCVLGWDPRIHKALQCDKSAQEFMPSGKF